MEYLNIILGSAIAFVGWFSKTTYDKAMDTRDELIKLKATLNATTHEDDKKEIESKEFRRDVLTTLEGIKKDLQEIKSQVSQEVNLLKQRLGTHENTHKELKEEVNAIRTLINGRS